jgi:ATP-dependent protease ClpP protease subunit
MKSTANISMPFTIAAARKGQRAEVRILGYIGWENNCEDFRQQVDALIADGIEDAHLYINSPGGSCVDAAEIVNIMQKFGGTITGEGGALVASAAAYIAMHCKSFAMPKNGRMMIHKPRTGVEGTAQELENTLKAIQILETQYYDVFKAKAKDAATLDKHWSAGDWWLTADEAKEQGFITSVAPKIKIDKATAAMIVGANNHLPAQKDNNFNNTNSLKKMEQIAKMLGLATDASEVEIATAVTALQSKSQTADTLATEMAALREKQITALVDGAVAVGKITADKRKHFADVGKTIGTDALAATFDAMTASVKPLDVIKRTNGGDQTKKWADYNLADIAALREQDKAEYTRLYIEEYKIVPEL